MLTLTLSNPIQTHERAPNPNRPMSSFVLQILSPVNFRSALVPMLSSAKLLLQI